MKYCVVFVLLANTVFAKDKLMYVDFTILGAFVGPTKVNGKSWDASFKINKSMGTLVSDMIMPGSGFLTSSMIGAVGSAAPKGKAAPDVIGYIKQTGPTIKKLVKVAGTPLVLASKYNLSKDNYLPNFETGYSGWPIFKDTRFRIQLWDKDLMDHDNIGSVEITYDDILLAIEKGKATWIKVADQSMNQLLYISVTARKSLKNTRPKMNGYRWE